jgi:hypothetical protein
MSWRGGNEGSVWWYTLDISIEYFTERVTLVSKHVNICFARYLSLHFSCVMFEAM